jgi:putative ABC transport system permease protein
MAGEAVLTGRGTLETRGSGGAGIGRIAWRNLWRNPRRTWLTAGGIAFAVWLLVVARSMQDGTFEIMVDNGARLLLGHVQIQHPHYQDDPRVEYTLHDSGRLRAMAEATAGVTIATERAQGFALVSSGERSFGGQVIGVDAEREALWSSLPASITSGRYLSGARGEAVIGAVLARNLGAGVGSELVLLGTAREGGVAAAVAEVVGVVTTGHPELDRALLEIPLGDFRDAWSLAPDEAHSVVLLAESVAASEVVAARLNGEAGDDWRALDWRGLMPEAVQTIDVKEVGTLLMFSLIAIIVTFSVVNTFMMTVFERTPEFGMLMAIGMRPRLIMGQLSLEALLLALVGTLLGLALSGVLLSALATWGLPLPAEATELLNRYNMPERMYPRFNAGAALAAALIMVLGTQLAALVPAARIRRMRPVLALRAAD